MTRNQQSRVGDWMQTFTGRMFWPLDPRPEDVDIHDIAHALSMQCRYGGHCDVFYSVAEHSVLISRHVSPKNRLWALLHDAAEAYVADVPRPLKRHLVGYKEAEAKVLAAICTRFGLPTDQPDEVTQADNGILADEAVQIMKAPPQAWSGVGPELGVRMRLWSPQEAEREFLADFCRLI